MNASAEAVTRTESGLEQAIRKAGSMRALAEALGITREAVSQWQQRGVVPAPRLPTDPNRILAVEQITGVHRHYLNPTVYPDPPSDGA